MMEQEKQADPPLSHQEILAEIQELREQIHSLREQSARREEKLRALNEIGRAINSVLDLDRLFEIIVEQATKLLQCELGSIMLVEDGCLVIKAARGIPKRIMENVRVPVGEEICGHVAKTGKSLLIDDLESDPRFQARHRGRYRNSSLLSVPIKLEDTVLGVINVTNKDQGAVFSAEDQEFLETIASQSAVAMENARLHERAQQLANTDGLTGLYNHRHFQERLQDELERGRRYRIRPISLAMVDIDHFKKFNDLYGHRAGDRALVYVSDLMRRQSRRSDIVCRYGGEEFAVILPEVSRVRAAAYAERVRLAIAQRPYEEAGIVEPVTVSIGVASYPDDGTTPSELIEAADKALYRSKSDGRNRVTVAEPQGAFAPTDSRLED